MFDGRSAAMRDSYHRRDGVGPARQTRVNTAWGNRVVSNASGTDEFMDFIRQIDAETYASLHLGSGTVRQAQGVMEYMPPIRPPSWPR